MSPGEYLKKKQDIQTTTKNKWTFEHFGGAQKTDGSFENKYIQKEDLRKKQGVGIFRGYPEILESRAILEKRDL